MSGCTRFLLVLAACAWTGALAAANCAVAELEAPDSSFDGDHRLDNEDEILVVMATRNDVDGSTDDTRTATAGLYARLANSKKTQELVAPGAEDIKNIDLCLVDDEVNPKVARIAYEVGGSVRKMQIRINCAASLAVPSTSTITVGAISTPFEDASSTYHNPSIAADGTVVAEKRDVATGRYTIVVSSGSAPAETIDISDHEVTMRNMRRPSISADGDRIVFQAEIPESHDGTWEGLFNGTQYGNDPAGYVYNIVQWDGADNTVLSTTDTRDATGAAVALPMNNIACTHPHIAVDGAGAYTVTWQSMEHLIDHYDHDAGEDVDALDEDKFGLSDLFRYAGGSVYRATASADTAYTHPMLSDDGRHLVGLSYTNHGQTYGWNVVHLHDVDTDYYTDAGEDETLVASDMVGGDAPMTLYPPAIGWAGKVAVIHTRGSAGSLFTTLGDGDDDNPDDENSIEDFVVVDLGNGLLGHVDDAGKDVKNAMLASMPNTE